MKTTKNTNLLSMPKDAQDAELKSIWKDMPADKAKYVQDEIRHLADERNKDVPSVLVLGQHLLNIHEACEPYSGSFMRICKSFSFTWRTAYRYIDTYKSAREVFPVNVLKAAMEYGLRVLAYTGTEPLGKYTQTVKLFPPPKNPTLAEAREYVVKLDEKQKEVRGERKVGINAVPAGREELLRMNYRTIRNSLHSLKGRAKYSFLKALVGMALTEAGISSSVTFEPEAIPDEFRRGPGYPKGRPRNLSENAA